MTIDHCDHCHDHADENQAESLHNLLHRNDALVVLRNIPKSLNH